MEDQPKDAEQLPRANWRPLILTGLVSLVVGVASGVLINLLTEKRLRLTYDVTTQEVFPGQQNNVGIFAIRVINDGKREIEQLFCRLTFPDGVIKERTVSGIPESARTLSGSAQAIDVAVPFLNPNEQFSIQVLMNDTQQALLRPVIDLRGKGVMGIEAAQDSNDGLSSLLGVFAAATGSLATSFIVLYRAGRVRKDRFQSYFLQTQPGEMHKRVHVRDDPRDVFAFALDANGLSDDAASIRRWRRRLSYWAASDFLTNNWLKSDVSDTALKGLSTIESVLRCAWMSDRTQRILFINSARLALSLDDRESTMNYLRKALSKPEPAVEARLHADRQLLTFVAKTGGLYPEKEQSEGST